MNKANFDSAKNVTVPNAWIEKALNLSPPRKRKISPFVIGTAASVVAVSTAVLFFNSKLSIQEFPMSSLDSTLPQESTYSTAHQRAPSTSFKATEPKEETQAMFTIPEYTQSEPNRQRVENNSSDELVETTENIVESSSLSASEPKETVTEEVTTATSYPFIPPATGYISGQYADSPDNIFMGILVFKIDERFKDSNYLFCHITEHGKEFSFCEKYEYRELVDVISKERDVYSYSPSLYDIFLSTETFYDLEFYDEWGHSEIFSGFQFQRLYGEIEINLKEVNDD